jgi:hypothetical protein
MDTGASPLTRFGPFRNRREVESLSGPLPPSGTRSDSSGRGSFSTVSVARSSEVPGPATGGFDVAARKDPSAPVLRLSQAHDDHGGVRRLPTPVLELDHEVSPIDVLR